MNKKIEKKIQDGYQLEVGELIDNSFALFKKNFLTAGLGVILLVLISLIIYGTIFAIIWRNTDFNQMLSNFENLAKDPSFLMWNILLSTIITGLIAPTTAGFIHINYLTKNNQPYSVETIFEFYTSKSFKDLFVASAIIGGTTASISALLTLNGLEFLNFIFQAGISCFTIFTIPLIIYENQNFSDALSKSLSLFLKQPLAIILGLFVAMIGAILGILIICIGVFFTLPLIYSMYFSIYDKAIGFDENSIEKNNHF